MLVKVSKMAKAVVAAAAAATAALVVATNDGALDTGDVITIILATVGALGATYLVPNKS